MHIPSTMLNTISVNSQSLIFAVVPPVNVSSAVGANLNDQDRDREVGIGQYIQGNIIFDLSISPDEAGQTIDSGVMQFIVFKLERQDGLPAIGVGTVPSNVDVQTAGMQQAWRLKNPGRIFKFSQFVYSNSLQTVRRFTFNPSKYKKAKIRPGDYIGLALFNQSDTNAIYSVQMRYKATI